MFDYVYDCSFCKSIGYVLFSMDGLFTKLSNQINHYFTYYIILSDFPIQVLFCQSYLVHTYSQNGDMVISMQILPTLK